jgi:signal transduction histidine kinase
MNHLKINLLDVSAYIAVGAVSIPGLITVFAQRHENRWVIAGLLFTFGFLLAVVHQTPERRQRIYAPHYFMLQTILVVSLLLLPPWLQYFNIFFFILSVDAMMLLPPRRGYLWIALFSLLTAGVFTINYGLKEAFFATPIYAGAYLFFGIFASTTARAEAAKQESQELLEELRAAHKKLQEYTLQVEDLAVAEERNWLAREMHDTLGHRLTVAAVQLEAAQRLISNEPERATEIIHTVRDQVREALQELRQTVAALREPLEADLSLPRALLRLATSFEQATSKLK